MLATPQASIGPTRSRMSQWLDGMLTSRSRPPVSGIDRMTTIGLERPRPLAPRPIARTIAFLLLPVQAFQWNQIPRGRTS
jgi:hypothetical protein